MPSAHPKPPQMSELLVLHGGRDVRGGGDRGGAVSRGEIMVAGSFGELFFPTLRVLGLANRLGAIGLISYGPGKWSLDHLLNRPRY